MAGSNFGLRGLQTVIWRLMPYFIRRHILWPNSEPNNSWASFDRHPWNHPWLTTKNIENFRAYSDEWMARLVNSFDKSEGGSMRYAFVGNMANNLYMRLCALSKRNLSIDTFLHPHDQHIMGQPFWEEYEGDLPSGVNLIKDLVNVDLPKVSNIYRYETVDYQSVRAKNLFWTMRFLDIKRFPDYFAYMPTFSALQKYDALLTVQVPYLAYLSGKPYAVTQMGGDIWYDCSRDDLLGRLQRKSFSRASVFIVSNPWSLAFARRYQIPNMIYIPFLIDELKYSPGEPAYRKQWITEVGGDFFVMMSSRIDYSYKGSQIAINAFSSFVKKVPTARLVVTGWGNDKVGAEVLLKELGILDKVLIVPVAGKKKLIKYLRSADCLIDQLILGYYGASALEGMACGLPVIMNLNKAQYDALLPEGCAPVCHAETESQVLDQLLNLFNNADHRIDVGKNLRNWFLKTHSNNKWGKYYEAILWGISQKKIPNFYKSPLATPLNIDEIEYHRLGLINAPIFPNYN